MNASQLSAVRKEIRELYEEMNQLIERFLERKPVLKGCVYESKRRCGKKGCACSKGQLHSSTVLAYRGEDKQRNLYPSDKEIPCLRRMTSDYQRLRRSRVRFVKASKEIIRLLELLEGERLSVGEGRLRKTEVGRKLK